MSGAARRLCFPADAARDYSLRVNRHGRSVTKTMKVDVQASVAGRLFRTWTRGVRCQAAAAAVVVLMALVAGAGWAQSASSDAPHLGQLVREAMARDTALAQRRLDVRSRQVGLAMDAAGRGFALTLRLSDPEGPGRLLGVTVTPEDEEKNQDGGTDFTFGLATNVTASLPHPFGNVSTTATLSGPAEEENTEETPEWELGPVAVRLASGVEQPLGSLIGLDATDADDLEAAHGVVRAERAARQRVRAIAGEVLDRMMAVVQGQRTERQGVHDVAELEAEVVRRREVFEDNENSHGFQSLLFRLEQERRALEHTRLTVQEERAALQQQTGFSGFAELGEVFLSPPPEGDVGRAPDVVDATVELRVSEYRIRENGNDEWPQVTFGAEYDWNETVFSAGVGFNLIVPIVDGGLRELKRERLANNRAAAELSGTSARRAFADAVAQAERDVRDLEYATWELRERTRLAALKVDESKRSLAAGVITESELAAAELAHELLAFDAQVLRARRWKLALALGAIADDDPFLLLDAAP